MAILFYCEVSVSVLNMCSCVLLKKKNNCDEAWLFKMLI